MELKSSSFQRKKGNLHHPVMTVMITFQVMSLPLQIFFENQILVEIQKTKIFDPNFEI